jgi:hypothetical protein
MSSSTVRRGLAVLATTVAALSVAGPAAAVTESTLVPPETMSVGEAVLIFAVIPLAFAGLVWLLVAAPGWTRGGRADANGGWSGDPLMLGGERAPEAPALPSADEGSDEASRTGGTGATW